MKREKKGGEDPVCCVPGTQCGMALALAEGQQVYVSCGGTEDDPMLVFVKILNSCLFFFNCTSYQAVLSVECFILVLFSLWA